MTMSTKSPIDSMNEYKGGAFPSPIIPVLGFSLGLAAPYGIVHGGLVTVSLTENSPSIDSLVSVLQSFGYIGMLFLSEFLLGAAARSNSAKASFSPAAAAATGRNSFAIVQANRIHQNHIESVCIFAPSVLAAAAACGGSSTGQDKVIWLKAAVLSWVGFRVLYRAGYCYSPNPFWRLVGTAASMTQSILCIYHWGQLSFTSS